MKLALLALPMAVVFAAPVSAKPADFAGVIADPARSEANRAMDEGRDPADVLDFAGLRRGNVVADYSAGGGYYTELLAAIVGPKGKVFALTGPLYFKAEPWDKLRGAHGNVTVIVSTNLDLAPRSVDMVFTHLVFHDLFLPPRAGQSAPSAEHVIGNWFAAVKPGGHVIIADHAGLPGDVAQMAGSLHRIDPTAAKAAMERAGFVLESESDVLHRSMDDHSLPVFNPAIRGKTDRFVMKFKRP